MNPPPPESALRVSGPDSKHRRRWKGGAAPTKRVPHEPNSPVGCSCEQDCPSDWARPDPEADNAPLLYLST